MNIDIIIKIIENFSIKKLEQTKWPLELEKAFRGKSGLHRAEWSLTATGGDPKESAAENIPPFVCRKVRVKR